MTVNKSNLVKLAFSRELQPEQLTLDYIYGRDAQSFEIGYMARMQVQCAMPYTEPKSNEYERRSGNFILNLISPSRYGLPYGILPRVISLWATSTVARTKQRRLYAGETISELIRMLGMEASGGRNGSRTRFREQLKRMAASSISISYDNGQHWALSKVDIFSDMAWMLEDKVEETSHWSPELILGEKFFQEAVMKPVPIDLRVVNYIRRHGASPLALDIYAWLSYRNSYLERMTDISWEKLEAQFGTNFGGRANVVSIEGKQPKAIGGDRRHRFAFRELFKSQLKTVISYYPAKVVLRDTGLRLIPSATSVPTLPRG